MPQQLEQREFFISDPGNHRRTRRFPQVRSAIMAARKWSNEVTEHSDALDLDQGVFTKDDPKEIAQSLKRSADRSKRRKGTALQSAMGMLTFYINRAGDNLGKAEKAKLEKAKDELRALFHKEQ
jgi:Protein of unknown function (DUF3175)